MAKSKDKGRKLPKRVGGVKLPKDVRKAGGTLFKAVNSPAGRELIAVGLSLAATAAAAMVEKDRLKRGAAQADGKDRGPSTGTKPLAGTGRDPHEIGVMLGKMAEAALAGLLKPKQG